jgi:hypothetical protein
MLDALKCLDPTIFSNQRNIEYAQQILKKVYGKKKTKYNFETEWRVILKDVVNGNQPFEPQAIKEIIFGCKIEKENKDKIIEIAKKTKHKIMVYHARERENEYALDLEEINLT